MQVFINGKQTNEEQRITYKENVKIEFNGFAILIRRDRRNKLKSLKNIESGYIERKNGNYELIINDKVLVNFSIRKRI